MAGSFPCEITKHNTQELPNMCIHPPIENHSPGGWQNAYVYCLFLRLQNNAYVNFKAEIDCPAVLSAFLEP